MNKDIVSAVLRLSYQDRAMRNNKKYRYYFKTYEDRYMFIYVFKSNIDFRFGWRDIHYNNHYI